MPTSAWLAAAYPDLAGRDPPPASMAQVALIVVLVLAIIYFASKSGLIFGGKREMFSAKAVKLHGDLQAHFAEGGSSYSQFKARAPDGDPVVYRDAMKANASGTLSPATVEKSLAGH
jgi:hypothetical protein